MGTYSNIISRNFADARVPEDFVQEVIQAAAEQSVALSLFSKAQVSTNIARMPVLSALPASFFVDGDTGLKQTTDMRWDNLFLNVEEIAVIVPIPDAVIEDASFDVWGEIKPRLVESIGRTLDDACIFGVNKPATWPAAIAGAAVAAGNYYQTGTTSQANGGIVEDINQVYGKVEADGFDVTGVVADRTLKAVLRSARATTGEPLADVSTAAVGGVPVHYAMSGLWGTNSGDPQAIVGDWSKAILGVRKDFTFKVLDQAVITDSSGNVVINLPQQDSVALRVVARFAFQVANPLTHAEEVEADRYPFGVLKHA